MLVTQVREKKLFFFTSSFPSLSLSPGFSFISVSPFFSPLSRQNLNNNKKKIFLHDPDHNMVEICNCGLIPVVPVQEGRSALSKRSSIDMGQHARAAAAARLVPGGAASLPAPIPSPSAQVTVCGPAGCFPARPAPVSIPECGPCCVVAGGGGGAAAATAVAADCTSSGAAASASALPSFTPHGVLHMSSDDGTVVVAAGSSPHLPRVRSRPLLSPTGGADKSQTWLLQHQQQQLQQQLQQQQQQREQNGEEEDEMMDAATQQADAAAAAVMSSPPPSLVSVAAGGGNGGGGGRG